MTARDKLLQLWLDLYGDEADFDLLWGLVEARQQPTESVGERQDDWFVDAVVYCAYVDLFAGDFDGLVSRLDYLGDLGVNALWLLPILDSPMRDVGFDVRDYRAVRAELLGGRGQAAFDDFLVEAAGRGIRVIFDVPLNHCSDEHPDFVAARSSRDSALRDRFVWSDDTNRYGQCRLLFKGMVDSNWEWDQGSGQHYFHRFYPFQPDWNYRNPRVLVEMIEMLADWRARGVAGFRLDAIPYLWKEEGTECENLPRTHTIIKIVRAVMDAVAPGTLLLAEACQPPPKVVEYFGDGDECNASYHFPLMPMIFLALARGNAGPIVEALDPRFTPPIPEGNQWFTFLRCHDELTLEMVTPEQRAELYGHYCRDPRWDFRQGEGVSARLATLLDSDPSRILLAYAVLLALPGAPIIFYGDEVGKENDEAFFSRLSARTGYADSRFFVRGEMDWGQVEAELARPDSAAARIYGGLRTMVLRRRGSPALGRGSLRFVELEPHLADAGLMAIERAAGEQRALVWLNLGVAPVSFEAHRGGVDVPMVPLDAGASVGREDHVVLAPSETRWLASDT